MAQISMWTCWAKYPHARHDDGGPILCTLPKGHDGPHEDHSRRTEGEILEWV